MDYTPIGDGRSVAISGIDGRIDWWGPDGIDAPPVFARLLGGHGCFELRPVAPFRVTRRYRLDSNVLETVFVTDQGRARLTESLNSGLAGLLPWSELARRVDGLEGQIEFELRLSVAYDDVKLSLDHDGGGASLKGLHLNASLRVDPRVQLRCTAKRIHGRFVISAQQRIVVALVANLDSPLSLTPISSIDARIDESDSQWRRWANKLTYDGLYSPEVRRSALALKLLLYSRSGAIAAAATTSLPERIGGDKNYDYRFAWVRDVAFSIKALLKVGAYEEAQAAMTWLYRTVQQHGPQVHVFYRLNGEMGEPETTLNLPGYRHSQPTRRGNGALGQRQLGVFGDLLIAARDFVEKGHRLDAASAVFLGTIADQAARQWRRKDSGIWELEEVAHYTHSKMSCWTALDVAIKLADAGHLARGQIGVWRRTRKDIHEWIERHCWSEDRRTYVMAAGSDKLDGALLLALAFGYPETRRLDSTRKALQAKLGRGDLMYRYSGMEAQEGCFLACSFWCVEALAICGHTDAARASMSNLLKRASADNGTYYEMIDPDSGAMLGNFPQGLSHLAMIHAAEAVSRALGVPT